MPLPNQIQKTHSPKGAEITRHWWVVDADGQAPGRVASEIARLLQGKHKPSYVPHLDSGDFVIVINTEKMVLSGNKAEQKVHYRHTGYPGGIKSDPYMKNPTKAFRRTVKGMLPSSKLGAKMLKKLNVYEGGTHPHEAQNPTPLSLEEM